MAQKFTFAYWPTRGLGQVSRLLLAYTGASWEDYAYKTREEWYDKDKQGLGFSFPNLPYLVHGDLKLTESSAINRYIINCSGHKDLLGKDLRDQAKVDMLLGVLQDIRAIIGPLVYNPEWQKLKDAAFEKAKPKFDQIQAYIGNQEFFLGYLTIVDFQFAEFSHYFEKIYPQNYQKYTALHRIRKNFDDLKEIKAYYELPTAVKGPFTSPYAAIQF